MGTIELVLQLLVPLALIAWVAIQRRRTRLAWWLDVGLAALYLVAIALAALWLVVPRELLWVLAVLLGAAVLLGRRRASQEGSPTAFARLGLGARVALLAALAGVAGVALAGRQRFEEPPIDLVFPLREGSYLVANGGSRELINAHLMTREGERYRPYRGQSYAVDLVRIGALGTRRSGLSPADPGGFAIFGDSIHAPCSGRVVAAVDGHPDRLPPGARPQRLEGNHVLLDCGGTWVLLAHLMRGSVRVAEGAMVATGEVLGRVGNSGRSDEPHLHIHAQSPGSAEAPLSGEPVPVTFGGRHLVRGDRVRGG